MTVSYSNLGIPQRILERGLPDILTDADLTFLIEGTSNRRYGLVKRALARGELIKIRRGLYALGRLYQRRSIHPFALAQHIYGPSYISFESALSHWGLIPEGVYTVVSGCLDRSTDFSTAFGQFSYVRIPYEPLYTQVLRKGENQNTYFIASPLRALCDYVYQSSRKFGRSWTFSQLRESLRLEDFPKVDDRDLQELANLYTHHKVQAFLKDFSREHNS